MQIATALFCLKCNASTKQLLITDSFGNNDLYVGKTNFFTYLLLWYA